MLTAMGVGDATSKSAQAKRTAMLFTDDKDVTKGVTPSTGDNRELCMGEATHGVGHSRRKRRLPRVTKDE